ncbi:hypothetical protein JW960_24105 [candidate division KSB1 bacterium]|nr:hypothetical protein [candidate division KSB1 bacterium]
MKKLNICVTILLFMLFQSCTESSNPQALKPDEQTVKIDFHCSFKEHLNTFTHKLTKDLVIDGTITIDFWLTKAEQRMILAKADTIDFFNLPDSLNWADDDSIHLAISPDPGIQYLRIQAGESDKTVYWNIVNSYAEEFGRLQELTSFIISIIMAKPEYKSLPEANGGYD